MFLALRAVSMFIWLFVALIFSPPHWRDYSPYLLAQQGEKIGLKQLTMKGYR